MTIATILLIANLLFLLVRGVGFMSFWWNAAAYGVELLLVLGVIITIAIIK